MTSISAVLPAYNEEALIGETATAVAEASWARTVNAEYRAVLAAASRPSGLRFNLLIFLR